VSPLLLRASLLCFAAYVLAVGSFGCDEGRPAESDEGSGGSSSAPGTGGLPQTWPVTELHTGTMTGSGTSSDRWAQDDVTRDGVNYHFMANGWGPNFESQTVSWDGTSFKVVSMEGSPGDDWEPASYPTVFCGIYSRIASGECGLPAAISSINTLRTGWSWQPNGNTGDYNAAYDIWLATGPDPEAFSGYLMVWFRDPLGEQPTGSRIETHATVENVPGVWDIWAGTAWDRFPIINWVRPEHQDTLEMEFDVMDFIRDAQSRGLEVPGTHILSVAVGFEMWQSVTNLETVDFFVDVN
jgi:hypothetical protein